MVPITSAAMILPVPGDPSIFEINLFRFSPSPSQTLSYKVCQWTLRATRCGGDGTLDMQ